MVRVRAGGAGALLWAALACGARGAAAGGVAGAASAQLGECAPGRERNLVVFLHGFGGRKGAFAALAEQLRLPKTAVLAFDGPEELAPELLDDPPGFYWFDVLGEDMLPIRPSPGERRRLASLDRARGLLDAALDALVGGCGWSPGEIFLFGYGHGGTLALDVVEHRGARLERSLGGAVGVATEVLPERRWQAPASPSGVPQEEASGGAPPGVLLIHGQADQAVGVDAAQASVDYLRTALGAGEEAVRLCVFPARGGEMLRGDHPEECRCLMEFLSDHLHGVGRRGSAEAMARLGAEPVERAELVPAAVAEAPEGRPRQPLALDSLD